MRCSEIIEKLADHFQNEEGYESRVSAYLSQMQKDGFIKLVIPVVQMGIFNFTTEDTEDTEEIKGTEETEEY